MVEEIKIQNKERDGDSKNTWPDQGMLCRESVCSKFDDTAGLIRAIPIDSRGNCTSGA